MQDLKHFNRATILTILTVGLSGLQTLWLHQITSCYGHKFFSEYFYFELTILFLILLTGLKRKIYIISYAAIFVFETIWFIINERPISPDDLLMLIVGATRIYILIWLLKRLTTK
jgi:hypothetical protein